MFDPVQAHNEHIRLLDEFLESLGITLENQTEWGMPPLPDDPVTGAVLRHDITRNGVILGTVQSFLENGVARTEFIAGKSGAEVSAAAAAGEWSVGAEVAVRATPAAVLAEARRLRSMEATEETNGAENEPRTAQAATSAG